MSYWLLNKRTPYCFFLQKHQYNKKRSTQYLWRHGSVLLSMLLCIMGLLGLQEDTRCNWFVLFHWTGHSVISHRTNSGKAPWWLRAFFRRSQSTTFSADVRARRQFYTSDTRHSPNLCDFFRQTWKTHRNQSPHPHCFQSPSLTDH